MNTIIPLPIELEIALFYRNILSIIALIKILLWCAFFAGLGMRVKFYRSRWKVLLLLFFFGYD